jgi:curved DNA-binding protein CbpA
MVVGFEGNLQIKPLPRLVSQIQKKGLSGVLHLKTSPSERCILFESGFPAGVQCPNTHDYLGSVLRELNFIDDRVFNESLMLMAEQNKLQGQVLLEMGVIDDRKLKHGLSLQLIRKLSKLFEAKSCAYFFIKDEGLNSVIEPLRINPFFLIHNAIRNNYGPDDLKRGLVPLIGKAVQTSRSFKKFYKLFKFSQDELIHLAYLQDTYRLADEFVKECRTGPVSAMMVLLSLSYCDMLMAGDAKLALPIKVDELAAKVSEKKARSRRAQDHSSPSKSHQKQKRPPRPSPASESGLAKRPVPEELKVLIEKKCTQLESAELWEILEVEKTASLESIKKSFFKLAKIYHPDRIAGCSDEEAKKRMGLIAVKINDAYKKLQDPKARLELMAIAQSEKSIGTVPRQKKIKDAVLQYQKARLEYKKRNYREASRLIGVAMELNPAVIDYQAWHLWLEYLTSHTQETMKLERAKRDLYDLVKKQYSSFWAARFLAKVLEKIGDDQNFKQLLIRAYRINPKNIDNTRDLRLFVAREKKAKGSFLGFRFKKSV